MALASRATQRTGSAAAPVVFLSYSHAESALAVAFRDALAACGLDVHIDVEHLQPGENITEFAKDAVRESDATICIISATSLKSAWVMFEAMTTLHKENADPSARLITCATDRSFEDPSFGLEITAAIDERLAGLKRHISEYLARQLDLTDLVTEQSRWLRMRAGFGDVLDRARTCLTVLLSPDTLQQSATRIADHIRQRRGQPPSRLDPRDIRGRAEELRRHLFEGRTDDALDRLLDFVREFSNLPEHIRQATLVSHTLRRAERALAGRQVTFAEAEQVRQPQIRDLLTLIDAIEVRPDLPVAS